jgi:hypothetical protein
MFVLKKETYRLERQKTRQPLDDQITIKEIPKKMQSFVLTYPFMSTSGAILNPLKMIRICVIPYKDSVRTVQQTHSTSVIKTRQLMLYKEKVSVCSEIPYKTLKGNVITT